jgi:polar amino acid transport system substrate-binding protein
MRAARSRGPGLAVMVLALSLAVAAAGCAKKDTGTTTTSGVKLIRQGKLVTCTHLPYAPFQSKDSSGKVVGFDVDLIDLVARKLKVTQEIVDTPFEGIKSGQDLNAGKCDVAAAGMTITEDRKKVLDFSDPYFDATQALLVATGKGYRSLADLNGMKVGVQSGTTGEDYVKKQAKEKNLTVEIVSYRDLAAEQQALATGQIQAAVNDLPVWSEYIKENPGRFVVSAEFNTGEQYGFAVRKGANPELLKAVNDSIAAARKDGTYDRIYEKWIGKKPAA